MDEKVLKEVYENLRQGKKVALATVVEFRGSVNKKPGTLMAITENGRVIGSIGEGPLEYKIIEKALQCIEDENDKELDFFLNDGDEITSQMPGTARIYIKVFIPRPRLVMIGIGDSSIELFKIAKLQNFHIVIFDEESESAKNKVFEEADEIIFGDFSETLLNYNFDGNTYCVITNKTQKQDEYVLEHLLKTKAGYIGVEGTKIKLESISKNLSLRGTDITQLSRVYSPMGLDIANFDNNEVAFSIIAEILGVKNKGTLKNKKNLN